MKNFLFGSKRLVVIAVLFVAGFSFGFTPNNTPEQITICHTPPGNPGNCHEITISINALEAHLDHGDDLVCHDQNEQNAYNDMLHAYLIKRPYGTNHVLVAYHI